MERHPRLSACCAAFLLLLTAACDKGDTASGSPSDPASATPDAKRKETVEALLRENGIDPSTLSAPPAAEPSSAPAQTPSPGAAPTAPQQTPPANAAERAVVEIISKGSEPHRKLAYKFVKGSTRKFTMDMTLSPKRSVNGQPLPSMPPITIGLRGTSQTIDVENGTARRQNTFVDFTPGTEGLPPELVAQMKAEFDVLKGTQLLEVVSEGGQILSLNVSGENAQNPQLVALLQNLQDGMTNAYLPLPKEPVGKGAKWKATNQVDAGGIRVTQVNEVTLKSIAGDKLTVELAFSQSAPAQRIQVPELPPDAQVELTGMAGSGKGSMTVDLASLVTDSKIELTMTVDTKISGAGSPEPVLSSTDTGMKIHLKVSE
jgi:hypothetical protein